MLFLQLKVNSRNGQRRYQAFTSGDSWFDSKDFLNGANKAYELIVTNFENGNKKALTPFLEKSVLSNFSEVIFY